MPTGELAIVLHTHMPYVEGGGSWPPPPGEGSDWANLQGFGTWPFGEEWLWEAIATSYVPLLGVLDELGGANTREQLTISLTPVLADQLEAPGAIERCIRFLREVRPQSHRLDIEDQRSRSGADGRVVAELEHSAADYERAAEMLARFERPTSNVGLLQAFGAHTAWTSSASHAILPLLACEESVDLQIRIGIESHRQRFAGWEGGFWLPECAHAPWLNASLVERGVRFTCVEFTRAFGTGDPRHLTPIQSEHAPVLVPIDRQTVELVWGSEGYPSNPAYRDYHRLTAHHHRAHANDGSPYDRARAAEQAVADAREFVAAVQRRTASGGLCVCAFDTELLGHWWFEGPQWLRAVVQEADRAGLPLTALNERAIQRHGPVRAPAGLDMTTSWGAGNDLRTWAGPAVAELVWTARTAELRAFCGRPSERALRELFALQASDWAFMVSRGWANGYPRQRASAHAAQLQLALDGGALDPHLRNLAPYLT